MLTEYGRQELFFQIDMFSRYSFSDLYNSTTRKIKRLKVKEKIGFIQWVASTTFDLISGLM